jgi:hypothetical protein
MSWISVCVYSVFVLSCVGSGLAKGWSPVQGVPPAIHRFRINSEREQAVKVEDEVKENKMDTQQRTSSLLRNHYALKIDAAYGADIRETMDSGHCSSPKYTLWIKLQCLSALSLLHANFDLELDQGMRVICRWIAYFYDIVLILSPLPLFWKHRRRLMRLPCCLSVFLYIRRCLCIPQILVRSPMRSPLIFCFLCSPCRIKGNMRLVFPRTPYFTHF